MAFGPVAYEFKADNAAGAWRVRHFNLAEPLSGVYHCTVDLIHTEADANLDDLLGSSASVVLTRVSGVERRLCGIIDRVRRTGGLHGHVLVEVEIVPALFALLQSTNARIFQSMKAPDILQKVLSDGLQPYQRSVKLDLQRTDYVQREYCVQYNEGDLHFVHRIMEEEGICYYFDHSGKTEEMVLVDTNDKFPKCDSATGAKIDLISADAGAPEHEVVHTLQSTKQLHATSVILHEYDWKQPTQAAHQEGHGQDSAQHERIVYDCDPRIVLDASGNDGATRKRVRQEELAALESGNSVTKKPPVSCVQ